MSILCKLGIHRPLRGFLYSFTDKVSGAPVYRCYCDCGKSWFTDGGEWFGFKVEKADERKGD